jgi:hypothetical protein
MKTVTRTFITETRPDPDQFNRAVETFWHTSIARLLEGRFDVGRNHCGFGFIATFRILDGDMQLTLTPERRGEKDESGEVFKHLRVMHWLTAAWKLRLNTSEGRKLTAEPALLVAA